MKAAIAKCSENQFFRKLETPLNVTRRVELSLILKDLGFHLN